MPTNKKARAARYEEDYNPFGEHPTKKKSPSSKRGGRKPANPKRARKGNPLVWVLLVALCAALGWMVRSAAFEVVRVNGDAMQSTLPDGALVLVRKNEFSTDDKNPARGDIVAVDVPGAGIILRRVTGLPGETVSWNGMGDVAINGETYIEPYISNASFDQLPEVSLAAQRYYVLCDNRAVLFDSRDGNVGVVPKYRIAGRACFVLWPLDRLGAIGG